MQKQNNQLIYLHGSESNSNSGKARLFRDWFPGMLTPDFIGSFQERMVQLHNILSNKRNWTLIGSSYGGLMGTIFTLGHATQVRKLILLAPALTRSPLFPTHNLFLFQRSLSTGRWIQLYHLNLFATLHRNFSRISLFISLKMIIVYKNPSTNWIGKRFSLDKILYTFESYYERRNALMTTTQQIYWHTTVQMPDDSNLTPLPEKVDVAVIGGGFTGLSAARTIAKRGVKVAVLEAETIGWGASSRNGGMTLAGLKVSMESVIKKYGRDTARRLYQCSLDSVDTVEQIVKEENIDCGFTRSGHLSTASKPTHYEGFKASVDFMAKEFNQAVRLVPPKDLKNEIGSDTYYGGLVDEIGGGLNPAQYVTGLAGAAEKAGATLHARARVNKLERKEKRFFIQTERGTLTADSVFVGTSGYTGNVTQKLQKKIIPIGSFIIATERLSDELAHELSPKNRMIVDSMHYLHYFRLWDNRMVFGGRAAFFPENKNTIGRSAEILRREMVEVYPQLKDIKVEYVWGGTLDFAFDMMTHVGEVDGIYYSLGYAGHGVAMATYLGKTVAEAMMNGNIKEHPFAQFDFPGAPLGLYNGYPWFLPFAGAWHKILDWVE